MNIDSTTVAFVTGAAGGIGAATVTRLRAAGATVITSDLAGTNVDLALDVTDVAAVRAAMNDTVATHGRLDLVVANAGIGIAGLVETLDDDAWDRSIAVNITGTINTIRAGYECVLPRRQGHLVAVASLAGLLPTPLLVPYATTKGGIVSFMTSLRPEAKRNGIGVSVICPGPVDTPLLDADSSINVRRYLTSAAGPAIPPGALADAIVGAVTHDRALVAPKRARALHLAARLTPGITERVITLYMRRELKRSR